MARIRAGQRSVLIVVDVQVGVVAEAWERQRVVDNMARAVQRAREQGAPVLWVQHHSDELPRDSAAWKWVPELKPAPGEALIHKQFNSSFENTTLEAELARLGATHIVLAGAQSNWCIRATAYGALERGYDLTLVEDAHTTNSMELASGKVLDAARVVDELNIAMKWLEYPGRRNGVAKVEALDFAAPGRVA